MNAKWKEGLFDCFSDWGVCCKGFWCPCLLYGETQSKLKGGVESGHGSGGPTMTYLAACCLPPLVGLPGCHPCLNCCQRNDIRHKYRLEGSDFNSFCASCFCHGCTLCQQYKEVTFREELRKSTSGVVASESHSYYLTPPQQIQITPIKSEPNPPPPTYNEYERNLTPHPMSYQYQPQNQPPVQLPLQPPHQQPPPSQVYGQPVYPTAPPPPQPPTYPKI